MMEIECMLEAAHPVKDLEIVHQSRQTSSKRSACECGSSESCDCECGGSGADRTTATDMRILRSLTPQEQQWIPLRREVRAVWVGFLMVMLDANGANWAGSRARSASVSRKHFILDSISANWSSDIVE